MDVTVVGSCVIDLISYADRLPKPGETILGNKFVVGCGGKGGNQCVSAAKLGAKVAMVAKIGDDYYGEMYLENLKKLNINTDQISKACNTATGVAQITVCNDGTNAIIVTLGANQQITEKDVENAEDLIRSSKIVVCQLEVPIDVTKRAILLARKHGVLSIFNPAPAVNNLPPEIYQACDIFCPNETEAEILTGISLKNPDDAATALSKLLDNGCRTVVITLGAGGVIFASQECRTPKHVPVCKVKALDTTGAGDSFVGSLSFYLSKFPSLSLEEAIRRANQVASVSVQAAGTQSSFPVHSDLPSSLFET